MGYGGSAGPLLPGFKMPEAAMAAYYLATFD